MTVRGRWLPVLGAVAALTTMPAAADEPETFLPGLDPEEEEVALAVLGSTLFVLHREIGDALVRQLDLPVDPNDPTVADSFAALFMTATPPAPLQDALLVSGIEGFMRLGALPADRAPIYVEAAPVSAARIARLVCQVYGSDPARFVEVPLTPGLGQGLAPEDLDQCPEAAAVIAERWAVMLQPHLPPPGADLPAGGQVEVAFAPPPDDLLPIYVFLRATGMVDVFAGDLARGITLPEDLTIAFGECGWADAYYDPEARVVILCWELVGLFEELALEVIAAR